jgi:hypothetical protein
LASDPAIQSYGVTEIGYSPLGFPATGNRTRFLDLAEASGRYCGYRILDLKALTAPRADCGAKGADLSRRAMSGEGVVVARRLELTSPKLFGRRREIAARRWQQRTENSRVCTDHDGRSTDDFEEADLHLADRWAPSRLRSAHLGSLHRPYDAFLTWQRKKPSKYQQAVRAREP